jgi:hypothetical protein
MIVYSTASHSLPAVRMYGAGSATLPLPEVRLVVPAQTAEYRASAMRKAHYVGNSWRWHCAENRRRTPVPASAPAPLTDWQAQCLEAVRWLRRWHAYDATEAALAPLPAAQPLSRQPLDCDCRQCLSAA